MSRLMAHMISHFPDRERSIAVADGLAAGGASYLEIQFPFSDPSADGPVIQAACQRGLEAGFTVDAGFELVREVTARHDVPVFIMTYASLIFARGVERFLTEGRDSGATGFIVPDLPLDYDEGIYSAADSLGTAVMPVIVTSMEERRLELVRKLKPRYLYVALRQGITGKRTELGTDNLAFLDGLKKLDALVMAGFGISERRQVEALEPHVHAAIVGSAFVHTVTELSGRDASGTSAEQCDSIRSRLTEQVAELTGR